MTTMTFIAIAIPTAGMIFLVKLMERELPKLIQRKREEWEVEKIQENENQNIELQKTINKEKLETIKKYESRKIEEKKNQISQILLKKSKKLTYKEKKEKGDKYEAYVADYFKKDGYYVWEHGKEKGKNDSSIDLFVKKDNHAYFIQCKNWESWKIDHKEIKATRMDIREYLKENREFWKLIKEKDIKILYVTSKECLTQGAYRYIQENREIIEYKVIPMEGRL